MGRSAQDGQRRAVVSKGELRWDIVGRDGQGGRGRQEWERVGRVGKCGQGWSGVGKEGKGGQGWARGARVDP